jgi:nicotinamide phosphoribosyltransferase
MQTTSPFLKRKLGLKSVIKDRLAEAIKNRDWTSIESLQDLIAKVLNKPDNLVLLGDAYKYSHHKFYEENTSVVYSYMESRGGRFNETVFYGLQMFMKEYVEGVAITQEELDEAYEYLGTKFGVFGREDVFDKSKFQYIIDVHGGRLPVIIKAVPEGTVVGVKNVLVTIENTDPNCYWLTNFLETIMMQIWYPITVATLSHEVKKIVRAYFHKTSDLPEDIMDIIVEFVLNDFGFRGVSSVQSAGIGGSAHLVNFLGSDTTYASKRICEYYNSERVFGLSVPATEHSIMTMRGEAGEVEMMKRVLTQYPTGIVACVSDSYNIFRACSKYWGEDLKELILSRPSAPGNQLVIRPDSGHVVNTLKAIFEILFDKFGYTVNSKGFKVLPPQVRVIQGDGVNINSIAEIYQELYKLGISAENIVFGMGGKLLQADINRDTQNFATKACFAVVDGQERDLVKSPTELDENNELKPSFKKSKQGRLKLVKNEDGTYRTVTSRDADFDSVHDELILVFENGKILVEYTFEEIRERVQATFKNKQLQTI